MSDSSKSSPITPAPRLLDELRKAALAKYARAEPTERIVEWVRHFIWAERFIRFHRMRHGKGGKDGILMLPKVELKRHLTWRRPECHWRAGGVSP